MKASYTDGVRYATEQLVRREILKGQVYLYEGKSVSAGAMGEVLLKNRNALFMTSADFMTYDCFYPLVIGEPNPKADIAEIAKRALLVAYHKVCLLVPLKYLATDKCARLIKETPLVRVYVLPKKLPHRWARFCWMVFERGNYDPPVVRWTE